jgi:hypothetical protein
VGGRRWTWLVEKLDSDDVWHASRKSEEGGKKNMEDVYSMLAVVIGREEHRRRRRSGMGVIVLFSRSGMQV